MSSPRVKAKAKATATKPAKSIKPIAEVYQTGSKRPLLLEGGGASNRMGLYKLLRRLSTSSSSNAVLLLKPCVYIAAEEQRCVCVVGRTPFTVSFFK